MFEFGFFGGVICEMARCEFVEDENMNGIERYIQSSSPHHPPKAS